MRTAAVAMALALTITAGCSGDNGGPDQTSSPGGDGTSSTAAGDNGQGSAGGRSATSLVIDGENIDMNRAACHLEPQEVSGGDGMILVTAQSRGTNAAGDEVHIDFTRWDSDSMFHGDDITVDIGELGESTTYSAMFDEGSIAVVDGVVSGQDITMSNLEMGDIVVSFELGC